jgi:hypothetical protein
MTEHQKDQAIRKCSVNILLILNKKQQQLDTETNVSLTFRVMLEALRDIRTKIELVITFLTNTQLPPQSWCGLV